ncbi:MAG TPA: HlyD family secretion protein [Phycisphaerae bacterium]|nr:HlyD family secretion protein [Phycisphaerae bacterium]
MIANNAGMVARFQTAAGRLHSKKIPRPLRACITAVFIVAAAALGVWAFRFYKYSPWTRDGRISAYVVDSAPEIGGQVIEVAVQDNQFVHRGDVLYRIDPRDYQSAVNRTQAALDAAKARLALQKENLQRREKLRAGDVAAEERQSYATNVQADSADVESLEAALYKATIDLERCEVRSSVTGWVTNLTVRVGNYANTGQRQMSVIDADSFWITGYFEETRLQQISVGSKVRAELIGYPDLKLLGHVESISRGIADTNTLPNPQGLPQVDPIFTWVRLAQRIPVRIHIDHVPDQVHLAVGETCTVQIERTGH